MFEAARETIFLRHILAFLKDRDADSFRIPLFGDNKSAIWLARTSIQSGKRTKHFDIKTHWLREAVDSKIVELRYVKTSENRADGLTKDVPRRVLDMLLLH